MHGRTYGIPYYTPIINAYFSLDNDINALTKCEDCVIGRQIAKVFLMDMIDEHYQCFRSEKEISEYIKEKPEYIRLLSGEYENDGGAEPRYISMCSGSKAYRIKNYLKGIVFTLLRMVKRSRFICMCFDTLKYRVKC